jgi:hypothetical protein
MAEILLVHGIGQENKRSEVLLRDWLEALRHGLSSAGQAQLGRQLSERRVAMAYYGHLFRKEGAMGLDEEKPLPPDAAVIATQLAQEWIARAAHRSANAGVREDAAAALEEVQVVPGDAQAQGVVQRGLRRLVAAGARIRYFALPTMAFAERVLNRALRQVSLYMANVNDTRDRALAIVEAQLTPDTQIVIGHSLGSVVAYEAAHRTSVGVPLLLTIGSPLGLDTIVYDRTIPQPPRYPEAVKWWVNVADLDDIVAADPKLAGRFPVPPGKQLTDHEVTNHLSAHGATDYLSQPEVVYPITLELPRAAQDLRQIRGAGDGG